MIVLEKFRQPVEVEPPDGTRQEHPHGVGPGLAVPKQAEPGDGLGGIGRVAADDGQLRRRDPRMAFGTIVHGQPAGQPEEAQGTGEAERGAPTPVQFPHDQRHGVGGDDDPHVAAAIEDAGGKGPLPLGVPLADGLDRGGEIAPFGQSQGEPGQAESGDRKHGRRHRPDQASGQRRFEPRQAAIDQRADQPMRHRGQAPNRDGQGQTRTHADAVHEPPHDQVADGIGQRERIDDRAVVGRRPMELVAQIRAQDAEDLAIDVAHRRGEEQQAANHPTVMAAFCPRAIGDGPRVIARSGMADGIVACGLP